MDLGVRASFEYPSATCYLPDNVSTSKSRQHCEMLGEETTDDSTHLRRSPCWVRFLVLGQTRKHFVVTDDTYWCLPGRCQRMLVHLEGNIQDVGLQAESVFSPLTTPRI